MQFVNQGIDTRFILFLDSCEGCALFNIWTCWRWPISTSRSQSTRGNANIRFELTLMHWVDDLKNVWWRQLSLTNNSNSVTSLKTILDERTKASAWMQQLIYVWMRSRKSNVDSTKRMLHNWFAKCKHYRVWKCQRF